MQNLYSLPECLYVMEKIMFRSINTVAWKRKLQLLKLQLPIWKKQFWMQAGTANGSCVLTIIIKIKSVPKNVKTEKSSSSHRASVLWQESA